MVTEVDTSGAPPPAPAPEPESAAAPEPKPEIKSKPEPKQEKKLTQKPVITNTPPAKIETNAPLKKAESKKPAVTNAPPKAKTLEDRLAEVRKSGKVMTASKTKTSAQTSAQNNLDRLRAAGEALNRETAGLGTGRGGSSTGSGSGSGGGMYSPFAGYYDDIKQRMYSVWPQPNAPRGTTATATIRVERNGTVSLKSITQRSGNSQFDQSVQSALNATTQLPPPPSDPDFDRTIEVVFELSD
ncbi:MAG: cell envelope integrity protein TolA [Kiritimatiellaceae bacterium]|nr:cell envelope integrity protein TolA [Kiritimatiellaceae bacterium]